MKNFSKIVDNFDVTTKKYVDDGLAEKANSSDLATVATSGSYDDLSHKPTIPDVSGKLDKSGGTITGDLTVGGSLTINGTTTTVNSTTLQVKDKLIEVAHENTTALTTPAGLIAPKYDGTNSGALVFDSTGTAYVGDVNFTDNGDIDVANSQLQPLATRTGLVGGNLVQYDSSAQTLKDSGKKISDLALKTDIPDISGLMPKSGGTFTGEVKFGSTENFQGYYIKRMLGSLGIGTRYADLDSSYKDGTWHRMWRLRFPSGSSFWGKIKITLYGGYSSFNASGVMSKSITCNFNTSNIYNNVGCYDGLGVNVEQDFRISEAIWNATASAWEVLIWQKNLSGNNSPTIMLECWTTNNTNYINAFNGIAAQTVELTQSTSYSAQKASPTGGTKTVEWATLPVYENPLGEEIATIGDLSNKANLSGGNTFTGKQTLTSPPTDGYSIDASGYVKGSWLQAPSTGKASSNTDKVCVLDGSGWVYYRTPAEIVSDGGGAKSSDIPTKVSELTNDSGYTTNKGTVTQVKINGTTNSPDSAGLVDLGTVGGSSDNSKHGYTQLTNENLDTITEVGWYRAASDNTCANKPSKFPSIPFVLEVEKSADVYIKQTMYTTKNSSDAFFTTYVRFSIDSGSTWTSWRINQTMSSEHTQTFSGLKVFSGGINVFYSPLRFNSDAGSGGQFAMSQGATTSPKWVNIQVKVNGTTYTADSNGLIDLGEISGGGSASTSQYNDIY